MRIAILTAAAMPAAAMTAPLVAAAPAMASLTDGRSTTGRSPVAPLDRGPYTADANRAYRGGGMVQERAPGMGQAPMARPMEPMQPMEPMPMRRDMDRPMR